MSRTNTQSDPPLNNYRATETGWQHRPRLSLTLQESNPERGRSPVSEVNQLRSPYYEELAFGFLTCRLFTTCVTFGAPVSTFWVRVCCPAQSVPPI